MSANSKSAVKVGSRKKPRAAVAKCPKEPTAAAQVREARAQSKRFCESIRQSIAAEDELRPRVADWVAAIRARLTSLCKEIGDVVHASRSGTVLHELVDHTRLSDVLTHLDQADCEAACLSVPRYDVPIPPLMLHHKIVCVDRHPLADEGARNSAPKGGA